MENLPPNQTYNNKTYNNKTYINQSINQMDGSIDINKIKNYFSEKLLHEVRETHPYDQETINEIELNICEMYFSESIKVKGILRSQDIVRNALFKLTPWHIEAVLERYKEYPGKIAQPKPFIQSMLYNVAFENDLNMTNTVIHDMYN